MSRKKLTQKFKFSLLPPLPHSFPPSLPFLTPLLAPLSIYPVSLLTVKEKFWERLTSDLPASL